MCGDRPILIMDAGLTVRMPAPVLIPACALARTPGGPAPLDCAPALVGPTGDTDSRTSGERAEPGGVIARRSGRGGISRRRRVLHGVAGHAQDLRRHGTETKPRSLENETPTLRAAQTVRHFRPHLPQPVIALPPTESARTCMMTGSTVCSLHSTCRACSVARPAVCGYLSLSGRMLACILVPLGSFVQPGAEQFVTPLIPHRRSGQPADLHLRAVWWAASHIRGPGESCAFSRDVL